MDIIEAIIDWFVGPFAPYTGDIPPPLTVILLVAVRLFGVYIFPVTIVRIIGRYTRRFVNNVLVDTIIFWPITLPLFSVLGIIEFLIDIGRGLFDRLIARLSRKIITQDESGTVYVEVRPISDRVAIKDRKALFVQVRDHTGVHRIQLDPDLLADRFTVRDAIAWTFDINPEQYNPVMET